MNSATTRSIRALPAPRLTFSLTLLLSLSLAGCSMVASLKGDSAPRTPDAPAVGSDSVPSGGDDVAEAGTPAAAPAVEESKDNPADVHNAIFYLDELEGALKAGGGGRSDIVSDDMGRRLYWDVSDDVKSSRKFGALKKRYIALKLAFARRAGPRAVQLMGNAVPTENANQQAKKVFDEALQVCRTMTSQGSTPELMADYQAKLDKAQSIDAATLHADGIDIKLATCELEMANKSLDQADDYVAEKPAQRGTTRGCGTFEFAVRQVKVGRGWGSWEYAMGSTSWAEKMSCHKLKKHGRQPHGARSAIADALGRADAKGVVTWNGKYTTQVDDDDLHVYRYATLNLYSRNIPFAKNACGGKGDKLVCEASGSRSATYYNHVSFYADRAAAHQKAGRTDRCTSMLKKAADEYRAFKQMHDEMTRSKSWTKGLHYKLRGAKKPMSEKAFLSAFDDLGAQVSKDAADYCGGA